MSDFNAGLFSNDVTCDIVLLMNGYVGNVVRICKDICSEYFIPVSVFKMIQRTATF
jgi:hypothetical protein